MSISQLAELHTVVADYAKLKDYDNGTLQLEGNARAIAEKLTASQAFLDNANAEEKALVKKYKVRK